MTRPWQTIARVDTDEGMLELRQRGERDFLITIAGRVLMTSQARRSEEELASRALARLPPRGEPHILIGGLGMGYTLRAALDALPSKALVTVVEINAAVAAWCRGPLAPLTAGAVSDPRVELTLSDVAVHLAAVARGTYDAILLDLYEGPHAATQESDDPLYGPSALGRMRAALTAGGVLAVWSEETDARFERRLREAGFRAEKHRAGAGGRAHTIYLGYNSA